MRDFGRALASGGIYLWDTIGEPTQLRPSEGGPTGVATDASAAHKVTLLEALAKARGGRALPDAAWVRLVSMLTVNPALAVLTRAGCPPSVLQHRFVIGMRGDELKVFTLGFIGRPMMGGPRPEDKHTPFLLTIDSLNLLDNAAADDPLASTVSYAVQTARVRRSDKAMRPPYLVW